MLSADINSCNSLITDAGSQPLVCDKRICLTLLSVLLCKIKDIKISALELVLFLI